MLTRRRFCAIAATTTLAVATPSLWPRFAWSQESPGLTLKELRDGAWAVLGMGGNGLLLRTDEGPVLVDCKVFDAAEALYDVVSAKAGAPSLIINTNHHGDHVGGNWIFRMKHADVSVIAHRNSLPRTAETLDQEALPSLAAMAENPETTDRAAELRSTLTAAHFQADRVYDDRLTLNHGDIMLELSHDGPGHTDNDTVVFIPQLNLLHVGDLVFHRLNGFVDMSGGCDPLRWPEVLRGLDRLGDAETIVVPGHGDVCDKTALPAMADYFDQMREIVEHALAEGRTIDEIAEMKPAVFENLGFPSILPRAIRGMAEALAGS